MLDCLIVHTLVVKTAKQQLLLRQRKLLIDFSFLFYPNPQKTDVFSEEICGCSRKVGVRSLAEKIFRWFSGAFWVFKSVGT
jgi:hypothetical protein